MLYINNRKNTNHKERDYIYNSFNNTEWCKLDEPILTNKEYKENLDNHLFILCPEGNGVDTHRIWESLYLGSIPVVKNHITHSTLNDLNILKVNNFNEVNFELLKKFQADLNYKDNKKLQIDYWMDLIRNGQESESRSIEILEKRGKNIRYNLKRKLYLTLESKYKIIKYYLRKIINTFFIYRK